MGGSEVFGLKIDCYSGISPTPLKTPVHETNSIMTDRFSGRLAHCLVNFPAVAGNEIEQPQVLVQLGQRETVNLVFIQVVQLEVPEIA